MIYFNQLRAWILDSERILYIKLVYTVCKLALVFVVFLFSIAILQFLIITSQNNTKTVIRLRLSDNH